MAMESACKLKVGREQYDGKVRMEADHIDFFGATKFRFRLSEIRSPRRHDDAIQYSFHGNPVSITLSQDTDAEEWIDYILHPQTVADKLGVAENATVRILNVEDRDLTDSLDQKQAKVVNGSSARCDVIMLGVERASELAQLEDLIQQVKADGAIWVVLPKGVRTITKANVTAAAREVGLLHSASLDFSESHSAHKVTRKQQGRRRAANNGTHHANARKRETVKAK